MTTNPCVCIADRELVIEQVKRAYVEGRLDSGELELRVGLALTVTTRLDLQSLMGDLPSPSSRGGPILGGWVVSAAGGVGAPVVFAGPTARMRSRLNRRAGVARRFRFTVLIVIFGTAGTAVITCWWAVLIDAGMSLHLVK